ncbi:unnamed protein product [Psylliodes chrysocephalus]|uniref:Uncharacterized protein n=1 Tax=Psylliodes chrysocephalus TaxID=3402493 RepID=A0A9P0CRP9_9CUCU|nr:unnamed protein product [Psylliodes chrysocephala]
MAKMLHSNKSETVNENHEQENDLNLKNISDLNNKYFLELNLEQLLSPEDISEIISNTEVVFERSSWSGILKSSTEQIANLEVMESTISYPTFEINNVEASLDQSFTNSLTIIPEENLSDPNYDATMECNNADSAVESIVEHNYSDQEPQGQVSEEDSDLDDQPASEHINRKRKGYNKRTINKTLRLTGKSYLGFTKYKNQKNSLQNKKRNERKIKERYNFSNKKKVNGVTRKGFLISNMD